MAAVAGACICPWILPTIPRSQTIHKEFPLNPPPGLFIGLLGRPTTGLKLIFKLQMIEDTAPEKTLVIQFMELCIQITNSSHPDLIMIKLLTSTNESP